MLENASGRTSMDYGNWRCVGLKTTVRIQPLFDISRTGVSLYMGTVVLTGKGQWRVSYQTLRGGVELLTRVIL